MWDSIWPLYILEQCNMIFKVIPVADHSREYQCLIPVPKYWECDFSFPFPFPKVGNAIFIPIPVPNIWEWAELFPFPKSPKSFPHTPAGTFISRSKEKKCH